jgi:hypothetical protein
MFLLRLFSRYLSLSLSVAERREKPNSPFILSLCNHCEALIYDHLVCYAQEEERENKRDSLSFSLAYAEKTAPCVCCARVWELSFISWAGAGARAEYATRTDW